MVRIILTLWSAGLVALGTCIPGSRPTFRHSRNVQRRQDDLSSPSLEIAQSVPSGVALSSTGYNNSVNGSSRDLPSKKWLGYGVNLFQVMPFDIDTVEEGTVRALQFIDLGKDKEKVFSFPGGDWLLPKNVDCDGAKKVEGKLTTFESGDVAASKFAAQASIAGKYEVITASGSGKIGVQSAFSKNLRYAMWAYKDHTLACDLSHWQDAVIGDNVRKALRVLESDGVASSKRDESSLSWVHWDSKDTDVKTKFRRFFNLYGTHIITGSLHGSTASVTSWASNEDKKGSEYFKADVSAAYQGLVSDGKFDASVFDSDHYKNFQKSFEYLVYCRGGDPKLAAQLEADAQKEGAYEIFEKWQQSAAKEPPLARINTAVWGDILAIHPDSDVRRYAKDMADGFAWLSENPQKHQTLCRMIVDSDWGEIALLSPAAYIIKKDPEKYPPGTLVVDTKFKWNDINHKPQSSETFEFWIINGGEKIDIKLSHGRDSVEGQDRGSILVYINDSPYENTDTDPKRVSGIIVNPIGHDEAFPPREGLFETTPTNTSVFTVANETSRQIDTFARRSSRVIIEQ